eukprot:scaffold88246_cov51-Phaeocystis_antarctica.AAC.2
MLKQRAAGDKSWPIACRHTTLGTAEKELDLSDAHLSYELRGRHVHRSGGDQAERSRPRPRRPEWLEDHCPRLLLYIRLLSTIDFTEDTLAKADLTSLAWHHTVAAHAARASRAPVRAAAAAAVADATASAVALIAASQLATAVTELAATVALAAAAEALAALALATAVEPLAALALAALALAAAAEPLAAVAKRAAAEPFVALAATALTVAAATVALAAA